MLDLEGNELEVGTIYILPGATNYLTVARFSHETKSNYMFKSVNYARGNDTVGVLYSWRRQIPKGYSNKMIAAIKMSQELIDKYQVV